MGFVDIFRFVKRKADNVFYLPPPHLKPLIDDGKGWYFENRVIAHALGADGKKVYTNSREAFYASINAGAKVFEADVSFTKDFVPMLSHSDLSEISSDEARARGILGLIDFARLIAPYLPGIYVILDIKDFKRAADTAKFLHSSLPVQVLDSFIFQISSSRQYFEIRGVWSGFKKFHYNFGLDGNPNSAIPFLVENEIHTASVALRWARKPKKLKWLKRYNIKCYAFTVNDADEAKAFLKSGIWGYFTDFLIR